jgi:hypothetical protein
VIVFVIYMVTDFVVCQRRTHEKTQKTSENGKKNPLARMAEKGYNGYNFPGERRLKMDLIIFLLIPATALIIVLIYALVTDRKHPRTRYRRRYRSSLRSA